MLKAALEQVNATERMMITIVMMMTFLKSMVDAYAKKSQQQPPF